MYKNLYFSYNTTVDEDHQPRRRGWVRERGRSARRNSKTENPARGRKCAMAEEEGLAAVEEESSVVLRLSVPFAYATRISVLS